MEKIIQIETLESEIKKFAETLPYWAKYLADRILSGNNITDTDIDNSYFYLLEELKLKTETNKPNININYTTNSRSYQSDLLLSKLENVEGVNALAENQTIEFSPNLTIIYGANGSGKSGYVRLLKKVFYSKAPEEILQNIHIESGHKDINAKFTFKANNTEKPLLFSDKDSTEFKQFAVFDGKGLLKQLSDKNEFEFRPSGLSFFANYTNAINSVEQKLNTEISTKRQGNSANDLASLFDGSSEIKNVIQNLNAQTKIEDLKKNTLFADKDKAEKEKIQKQYDELLLTSKGKEKEIGKLENIKKLLDENKQAIETLNKYFSTEALSKIKIAITDYIDKENVAKTEGIEKFNTSKIQGIGTTEWKMFIIAAETFAKQQGENYPSENDTCIFCQQSLSSDAKLLVSNYWTYIKSVAEQQAKEAQTKLAQIKQSFEKLNFNLFPDNNILTVWLAEKYPQQLQTLKQKISEQKTLSEYIVKDIENKTTTDRTALQISTEQHNIIDTALANSISSLKSDEQSKELAKLLETKTSLEHKEKVNTHFSKFENYVNNQIWIKQAEKASFAKRKITETEKSLSDKYFSQKYIDTFNEECKKLNGNFGIDINHTGTAGKSYRQLKIRGKNPNAVLSEGEQKVIAIADFLAEMHLSEINRGLIFDDPVNSLDNDRKKQIAERLVNQTTSKQVIIFTHDLVFFYHLKNYSKKFLNSKNNSFIHHSLEREDCLCGKVVANTSPANEGQYHEPTKAEEWLKRSKNVNGNDKIDFAKSGLSALRTSYEALAIFTILGGTVQRFDPHIKIGRLKDIKYEKSLIESVIEKHGEISNLIEGHLPSDDFGIIPSPEILEQHINDFKHIKTQLKNIQ